MLTQLFNLFLKEVFHFKDDVYTEQEIDNMRTNFKNMLDNRAKPFLEWLIKNGHIEEIKSEKKSGPDLNDYIKYIAETEDPIKTLVDMLK